MAREGRRAPQMATFAKRLGLLLVATLPTGRAISRADRQTTAKCWSIHGHANGCPHGYGQAYCEPFEQGDACRDLKCILLKVAKGYCECKCGWYAVKPTAENGWLWSCKQYDPTVEWDPHPDVMKEQRKSKRCPEDDEAVTIEEETEAEEKADAAVATTPAYSQPTAKTVVLTPTTKVTTPEPTLCCEAMTATCLACKDSMAVADFCAKPENANVDGCAETGGSDSVEEPTATTKKTTLSTTKKPTPTTTEEILTTKAPTVPSTTKEVKMCCMALQADCLACNAGLTLQDFCGDPTNADTPGCQAVSTTADLLSSVLAGGILEDKAKPKTAEASSPSTTPFDESMMPKPAQTPGSGDAGEAPAPPTSTDYLDAPETAADSTTEKPGSTTEVYWRLYSGKKVSGLSTRPWTATAASALVAGVAAVMVALSAVVVLRGSRQARSNRDVDADANTLEERALL